jgi:Tfp pilus assembly protein PilF
MRPLLRPRRLAPALFAALVALTGCDRSSPATGDSQQPSSVVAEPPEEPSPHFRNVDTRTSYVGDGACASCHVRETAAYREHAMAQSFHRWTPATRIETPLEKPLQHGPTGFSYSVVESGGQLYQVEFLTGPGGTRLHELRRRMDYVMGSGQVARTYFTEENGRLFQLPLTWYRSHGWDFSPGYEIGTARFDRVMPDRCIACHSSYPRPIPHLEGKYAEIRPGIGCERCHGPGGLHVAERRASAGRATARRDTALDRTIVNPAHLPLERRLDTCEQCHVHTAVTVLREGKTDFDYMPSQPLREQYAFYKVAGSIDIVSHADRLRQSACFIGARGTSRPLECATCHDPHQAAPAPQARNQPCRQCHASALLAQRLARSPALPDHTPTSDCVSCHMPRVAVRAAVHGAFTDHWIRVTSRGTPPAAVRQYGDGSIEPYYERDKTGADAAIYQGMGEVVYATLATSGRALTNASTDLARALGADSGRGDASFLLGVASQQLGNTEDAIRALEQSIRVDSTRPDRWRALAVSYARAGRPAAAIDSLYRRALALQPALAWIRADHADYLQGQGRLDDAVRAYQAALAEQPSLATARFNLGTALAAQGRVAASGAAFQQAVHLDPSLAQALSPLLEVRTSGRSVVSVSSIASPLPLPAVRERDSRAVQLTVAGGQGTVPSLVFGNVPPRGIVQILTPDGSAVRTLPTGDGFVLRWDLRTDGGDPIGGGLYRVRVVGRGVGGQATVPQQLWMGVVQRREE